MEVEMYTNLISIVNTRIDTIKSIFRKENGTGYEHTDIEFISHQIILTLELIALGALLPNEEEYNKQLMKFRSSHDVSEILDDLAHINPDFYPNPLKPLIKGKPDDLNMVERKEGFLTKQNFVIVYKECRRFLHSEYPFNDGLDYKSYFIKLEEWVNLISGLVEVFTVKLLNPDIPALLIYYDTEACETRSLILHED